MKTFKGTSKNQHRSSAAPKLLANDSGLFPFRFYGVHPKDAGDPKPQQFFEVPLTGIENNLGAETPIALAQKKRLQVGDGRTSIGGHGFHILWTCFGRSFSHFQWFA